MLEICFGAVCAPRAEARLRIGLQQILAWAQKRSQYLERVFGPFASHSAVHVAVMNSSSGYQKIPTLVQLCCALYCNLPLLWAPIKQ